jgi:nitroreductase
MIDHASVSHLIRQRRSLKPVDMDGHHEMDRELLMRLLEDATWAPNHGLTEPWHYHLFQGESRRELAEMLQSTYKATTPEAEFRADKMEKMGKNPLCASIVVAACMMRRGGSKVPAHEELAAVACSLQNLMLSATAAGVGSYWSSPPLLDSKQWKEWLGLGAEDICVGLIYLGYPHSVASPPRSTRSPVETCITWR